MNYICCNYDIWMCLKMVQTIPMYSPIFPANSISSVQLSSSPCLLDIFPLSMGDNVVVPVGIYSHYIYILYNVPIATVVGDAWLSYKNH